MLKRNNILFAVIGVLMLAVIVFVLDKFILNQRIQLKKESDGNINVLLLGRGGGAHDGPNLTDTIILANINPAKNQAILTSIPRDLWIPDIKGRINSAYAIGQGKNKQGILLAKAAVQKVTGENIDYTVVIDFSGFVNLIDHLGGIDVRVNKTLDDYAYPIEGKETDPCESNEDEVASLSAQIATGSATESEAFSCRYKHLHFDSGLQHMDGKKALEFSRSRHAFGSEGNDFARSQRQQTVINAVKDKVLSLGIMLNPIKVIGIFNIIKDNIDTNIQVSEFDDFINLARKMQGAKIKSVVIDFGDEGKGRYGLLVESPPSKITNFQFALLPRIGDGDFSEIHEYIKCIEKGLICKIEKEGISREIKKD